MMEKVNEDLRFEELTTEILKLKQEVLKLKEVIIDLSKNIKSMNESTSRMDNHIDFVENTYETLNDFTDETKNVWIVFHGIGYLSKYFLKYFDELNPLDNYIIAPQAPSKYYLNSSYKHVGASWLTKENTETEINNNLNY